jgi:hypothetical protein
MSGAIPPLPQYTFMVWCSVKAQGQLYLYLLLYQYENISKAVISKFTLPLPPYSNNLSSYIFLEPWSAFKVNFVANVISLSHLHHFSTEENDA